MPACVSIIPANGAERPRLAIRSMKERLESRSRRTRSIRCSSSDSVIGISLVQGVITCDLLDCTGQAWNGPAAQAASPRDSYRGSSTELPAWPINAGWHGCGLTLAARALGLLQFAPKANPLGSRPDPLMPTNARRATSQHGHHAPL